MNTPHELPTSPPPVLANFIEKFPAFARVNDDLLSGILFPVKSTYDNQPQNMLPAALDYLDHGFSIIPIGRDKKPAVKWQDFQRRKPTVAEVTQWFGKGNYNIGIVTGELSGLTVVDFDTPEAIEMAKMKNFPSTPFAKTGKGYHAYCQYAAGSRNFQKRADLPGIDLRSEGGYVVAPPSIHENGAIYQWVKGRSLDDVNLAEVPEWTLAKKPEERTPINELFKGTTEGNRNESLVRVAGSVIGKGFEYQDALQFCLTWNERNSPPLPELEVETTVKSIWQKHQKDSNSSNPVLSVLSGASLKDIEWSDPIPLPEGLAPVKSLTSDMLPAPLRGWLMDIADRMQIPPDFSTAAAVVALGSIIGRGCGIHPKCHDDWLVVPNLWGAVVGRPSLMKTPAISEAQRHLNRLEAEAREEYQKEAEAYEIQKEVLKISRAAIGDKIKKALKSGGDIEIAKVELAALRDKEPTRRRYQTQDGTTEKIGELLNQNPRGLLVNRDELIGWFRSLDRDGREGDRAFYLEAWNGNRGFTYDRIGRGTLDISALSVSIFGAITPGPLSAYVYQSNRGGNGDDGLLQRFQVFVWPDAPAEWRNVDRFPDTVQKNRAWEIYKRIADDIPGMVKEDGADIPALRFSPEGQEVFDTWRNELETRLRGDHGLPPVMESHLTKYRKLMPSLALIFHLVDVADRADPGPVSEQAALMAVAWCKYLESHAGRIYGAAIMPGMEAAREILKHLRRGAIQNGSKIRDIQRNQWSRLATPEEVNAGLDVLAQYEWLTLEKKTTGGRPSEIITLNPRIKL